MTQSRDYILVQTVYDFLCDGCSEKVPFQESTTHRVFEFHDWIKDGRVIGRTRCTANEFRHFIFDTGVK